MAEAQVIEVVLRVGGGEVLRVTGRPTTKPTEDDPSATYKLTVKVPASSRVQPIGEVDFDPQYENMAELIGKIARRFEEAQ